MSDTISRADAIDAIEKLDIPEDMCVFEILSHIELAIGTLPSAEPCDNCIHDDEDWDSEACDGCISAEPNILNDDTLTITVQHGMLSKVNRVIVDEVGTKFCKMMYQEELQIIRCKECKHYETFISTRTKDGRMVWDENCVKFRRSTTADGFCAWAERRTDE